MTDATISLAKITRPSLKSIVPRERLFARLESGLARPLVWIQGPPGSGKTTLVSSFLEQRGLNHLWYQVDPDDNDIATFFYFLRMTLTRGGEDESDAEKLGTFSPEFLHDVSRFARRFFREMYLRLPRPFVIVLDGYQDVQAQSRLHEVIQAAVTELPADVSLVIMSRGDPIPQMARHRANRKLELLTWDDLRLTRDETAELARLHADDVSSEAVETLFTLTEGWAAGLVLLMDIPHREHLLGDDFSDMDKDVVFDYFAEEAFNAFDAATQEFLLRTACMPRMTVDMVKDLTGLRHAPQLLKELNRRNYFVSERSSGQTVEYQYHPLFQEFLGKLAQERYSEEHYRDLRGKVARILLEHKHFEAALEIFLELSEWAQVEDIIASHAPALLAYGRSETLAQWLEELPGAELSRNPWMLYWSAAACFHTSPRKSRQLYERAFNAFERAAQPNVKGMVLSCCGATDTILVEADDFASLDPWIARSEALLTSHPGYFEGREFARVAGTMLMAVVIRQPQHRMLDRWIESVARAARSGDDLYNRLIVAPLAALAMLVAGRLSQARTIILELREYRGHRALRPQIAVMVDVMDAMDRVLSGVTADCLDVVDGGLETAVHHGYGSWVNLLLAFGAGTALIEHDLAKAWTYLNQLDGASNAASRLERCLFQYFRGWASLIAKDKVAGFQSFKLALSLSVEVGMPALETLCRSGLARVAFDCGDRRAAESQMRKVHALVRNINNPLLEFQTLMTFADLALGDGRTRAGLNALRFGLGLGREHGFEHVMGWQPNTVANLCVRALEEDIETDYVKRLIVNSHLIPEVPPYAVSAWPWKRRIRSLNGFRFPGGDDAGGEDARVKGRPLDLLKVLLAHGGRDVKAETIARTLWPHVDIEYAYKSFTINLHRLRKLFGYEDSIVLKDGCVSLDGSQVWFDVWALEQTYAEIDTVLARPLAGGASAVIDGLAARVRGLYSGPFLGNDTSFPCYAACRAQLGAQFIRYSGKLLRFWERHGRWEEAAHYCEAALSVEPAEESFYRQLMTCYRELQRPAGVLESYERCRQALASAGGRDPSLETQSLYESLRSAG